MLRQKTGVEAQKIWDRNWHTAQTEAKDEDVLLSLGHTLDVSLSPVRKQYYAKYSADQMGGDTGGRGVSDDNYNEKLTAATGFRQ